LTRYAKPSSLDEALDLLATGRWRILAGATDIYPALGGAPFREDVLDINAIAGLSGVTRAQGHWRIGARTTWSQIVAADLPPGFEALRHAAREVGSVQIQNTATVAGNLCNASPAADGVPPLLALDARVELRSRAGTRMLALSDFIQGNRRIARNPDELVTAILVPEDAAVGTSAFVKLGARRYLVISIAMVAARLSLDDGGRIAAAAIAVGSCSAVAVRLDGLERALIGMRPDGDLDRLLDTATFAEIRPIDDVRGTAQYRTAAARVLVARAVAAALGGDAAEARAA
jgi:CO/xanthine dehydrogenase FAD-binding subunit